MAKTGPSVPIVSLFMPVYTAVGPSRLIKVRSKRRGETGQID